MPTLEMYNSSAENEAIRALESSGSVVWSDYHDAWLDVDEATHSHFHNEWFADDQPLDTCDRCGEIYHYELAEDSVATVDHNHYCDTGCAENAGYHCNDDGEWTDEPESGLREYHSGSRHKYATSLEHPFLIGFEIEKEDQSAQDALEESAELPKYWVAEQDASLNTSGYELVTPAYNLADSDKIESDFDEAAEFIDADSTFNCGGHITISQRGVSGFALADQNRGLFPLLMALYPRRLNKSCVKSGKYKKLCECQDRYRPFNITSTRIELRLISRVRNTEQLKWRYRLIKWMLETAPTLEATRASMVSGWLRDHLLCIYTEERIDARIRLFDDFADYFYSDGSSASAAIEPYLLNEV